MRIVKKDGKLKIVPSQLKKGIEVEQEHAKTVHGDAQIIMNIAKDHLREDPNYYDKLEEMEEDKKGGKGKEEEKEEKD